MIVAYGSIHIYHDKEPLDQFVKRFPKVPIIFLEDTLKYPGTVCVATNNYQGTAKCVEHLISQHGCKKIAFLAGPKANRDSNQRLTAYQDVMRDHNLPNDSDLILHGDFSESVDSLVEQLLDKNPGLEAIVSANDEMALSIYKVCAARGIQIGKDLLVTGFDDIDMASYLNPPLTTVRQDVAALAQAAVDTALAIFRNEPVFSKSVDVEFVQRESCGCDASQIEGQDALLSKSSGIDSVAGAMVDLRGLQKNSWIGPSLVRVMISEIDHIDRAMKALGQELVSMGCPSAYIFAFEEKYEHSHNDPYVRPKDMRLILKQVGTSVEAHNIKDGQIVTDASLSDVFVDDGKQHSYISFLLFDGKMQYGMFSAEIEPRDISFYYTLSLHISTYFRFLEMNLRQKEYREELKEKNNILKFSASHDPLTGLYNRYGALEAADIIFTKAEAGRVPVFFIADLDHLKEINDTFGHTAGDHAIRVAAELLNSTIGSKGLVARVGGDEFCGGFLLDEAPDVDCKIQDVFEEISQAFDRYNEEAEEDFYVEVSVGFSMIHGSSKDAIHQAYIDSDLKLYDAKKKRRPSIAR